MRNKCAKNVFVTDKDSKLSGGNEAHKSAELLEKARADSDSVLNALGSQPDGLMLYVFDCRHNPALFHTGWFVESLFTQTLIIHVIRTNKIPFFQSRASWPLILASALIVAAGAWLTVSPLAGTLGFVPLPPLYWLFHEARKQNVNKGNRKEKN